MNTPAPHDAPTPPPTLRYPPPREEWEFPPRAGRTTGLRLGGRSALQTAAAIGSALLSLRLGAAAHAASPQQLEGLPFVGWLLLGGASLLFGLAPIAWLVDRFAGIRLTVEMLTDHHRLARVQGRPPIWLDEKPAPDVSLRVAHLSDLHIAERDDLRLVESGRPVGNKAFEALLSSPSLGESDLLIVTGDITDRGTAASWKAFFELLDARGLADRTLLVPGNHDLMFLQALEPGHIVERALGVDRFAITQLANLYKFGRAFARTLGGRVGLIVRAPELELPRSQGAGLPRDERSVVGFAEAWRAVETELAPFIEGLTSQPVPTLRLTHLLNDLEAQRHYRSRIEAARRRLLALFPVAVPVPGRDAVVFVLNSCTMASRHPALNALGLVGREQYRRLDALARCVPQRLRLAALHHHLVRRGEELATDLKQRVAGRMGLLGDWWRVVSFCREQGIRAVLNGHRHLSYELRLPNGSALLAAPSSTLGDELTADPRPQIALYTIPVVPVPDNTVNIFREVVRLSGEEAKAKDAA